MRRKVRRFPAPARRTDKTFLDGSRAGCCCRNSALRTATPRTSCVEASLTSRAPRSSIGLAIAGLCARHKTVVTCFLVVARLFKLHFGATHGVANAFDALSLEIAHDNFFAHGLESGSAGSGCAGPTRRSPLLRTLVQIHGVRTFEDGQHVVGVFILDAGRQQLPTASHSFFICRALVVVREEVLDALPQALVSGSRVLVARILTDH